MLADARRAAPPTVAPSVPDDRQMRSRATGIFARSLAGWNWGTTPALSVSDAIGSQRGVV
jgi:hypothetical protein